MKLVGLVSILPACTYATFTQMAADFLKLQTLEENRGLGNAIGLQAFADIDGYGCWCHFEDDHGIGRGQAQDAIDNHCRTTHNGYSCAIMDHGSTAGFQSFFGVFFLGFSDFSAVIWSYFFFFLQHLPKPLVSLAFHGKSTTSAASPATSRASPMLATRTTPTTHAPRMPAKSKASSSLNYSN